MNIDQKRMPFTEIRLEGRWLAELGFEEERSVRVEQSKHRLVTTIDRDWCLLFFCSTKRKVTKEKVATVKGATRTAAQANPAVKCRNSI